jgi:ABC-2 type transport system permease protein
MFKEIFIFELKQWVKRPGIYIYFGLFLALSFLLGAVISGIFSGISTDTNSYINSAGSIAQVLTSFNSDYLLGLIMLLICVALMAGCVQKDFQYNSFSFYFTKPISKFDYLIGRFSASFLLTLIVLTAIILGLYLSFFLSPNDNGQIGEFKFVNFFQPFIIFLVPNAFLIGAIFFSLVTFTRNMTSGYVGSLVFIVTAGIARSITSDIDNKTVSAILDPFGQQAFSLVTEYWTSAESNTRLVPFSSYILFNRLFWIGVSLGLIALTYDRFNFNQFLNPVSIFKRKQKQSTSQPSKLIQSIGHLPKVTQVFDFKLTWFQTMFLTKFEFFKITRSVFFYIIVALSILLTVLTSQFSGLIYGTVTYPLTYMQIETGSGIFRFFLLIMIIFYSGIVIWRERDSKVDELVGASPVSNGVLFISKFLSLVFLCITIYTVCIITCILIQTYSSYYNYEIGLYLTELIGLKILPVLIQVALAVSLQVFFKNRYFAYFTVVIIVMALPLIYNAFSYNNDLAAFNSSGNQMRYSDMNGHGHTLFSFFIYKMYWAGFMLIVSAIAVLMYHRGKENAFKTRWKQARKQIRRQYKMAIILGMLFFFGCGSIIFHNTRVLNPYKSAKDSEKEQVEFEKLYKKYETELQPRIVESNVNVDIFPDELGCKINGYYYLKNKHKLPVKKIFINIQSETRTHSLKLLYGNKKIITDTANGFFGYELNNPLLPNDSVKLEYLLEYFPKNFIIKKGQTQFVENGTFFNSGLLPSIGYNPDGEIDDNSTRKKYKLQPKPRMAKITDTASYANTYISNDADWIRFECIISTKEGQTAIAPGYLQKEWAGTTPFREKEPRHYFHYKMNAPILNFYAFLSARYEIKKDKWINPLDKSNEVNIEIYYHKGHEYNIERMIKGIKRSLDYYTKNFSPYQHKQVRILEFPRYATFAQSFPNTIPFSEGIGFVAKVNEEDPNEVDYPFYVTAHEVAHQWWAHQVIGANVQGCTVMSETMSQYSALMVMEKEFGQASMSKFLKYEMDNYLKSRAGENKKEVPLMLCENQQYIHYNKGSVVMYALKDYLGEDTLNAALKRYVKKVAFQEPPFTTAIEFYSFIKAATPDSLKETVKDLFERIIVFDNSVKSWTYAKTNDGKYKITAMLNCLKTKNDSLGKSKELVPNDWIDIGAFSKNEKNKGSLGQAIYLKKIKLTNKEQKIELTVDKEPFMFGIDPYYKLIDKSTGNNTKDKNGKDIGGGTEEAGSSISVKSE